MGTRGYEHASRIKYLPGEMILEVGTGASTTWLSRVGPHVVTIDPTTVDGVFENIEFHQGYAETFLNDWTWPIGFAWLDGHDWPYTGNPAVYYETQRQRYLDRGQIYSQEASRQSHLRIAQLIADHARVIAFDDTWATHYWRSWNNPECVAAVPPATQPAPALAMDKGIDRDRNVCWLEKDHPHHDRPEIGWNGKGGDAIPYLIEHDFHVIEYGLGLVILERN